LKTRTFNSFSFHSPGLHGCAGQTGSGKTALLFSVAESIHDDTDKDIYIVLKETDRKVEEYKVPKYIHSLTPQLDVPQDCIIIGDDWQRIAPARRSMSTTNVTWDEMEGLVRHDGIDLLLDVQTYATLDRNAILRIDYRWYKMPYQEEATFGRPELKEEAAMVRDALQGKPISTAYLISRNREDYEGLVSGVPLPRYWTPQLSTMHRRLSHEEMEERKPLWERFRII
jgi:hypothetical protein